jgi:hypothetical protein
MAYKLKLPSHSKIHQVFHVSYLKKVVESNFNFQISLSELDEGGSIWLRPEAILDKGERRLFQCMIHEVLIQCKDAQPEDATWKLTTIFQHFPHLQP